MEYRRLGKAGVRVSVFSFGSWVTFGQQIGGEVAEACMREAYEAGCNFFDNAEAYAAGQSEIVMGAALKKFGWRRDSYLVSSKVFFGAEHPMGPKPKGFPNLTGLSRKHIFDACHQALERLQVDYLDLYFCHRPDFETPIEETVRAMTDLVRQGKVLYWGTSEWSAQQIQEATTVARQYGLVAPQMEQPQYHCFHRERVEVEYAPLYDDPGIGTTIWSPLASGLLTGKYNDGIPEGTRVGLDGYGWLKDKFQGAEFEAQIAKVRALGALAQEAGFPSMARFALAWAGRHPRVSTVITGASRPEQVVENMKAADDLAKFDAELEAKVEAILENQPEGPQRFS